MNERHKFKKFNEGKQSTMTQERIDQLNSIGFEWFVGRGPSKHNSQV